MQQAQPSKYSPAGHVQQVQPSWRSSAAGTVQQYSPAGQVQQVQSSSTAQQAKSSRCPGCTCRTEAAQPLLTGPAAHTWTEGLGHAQPAVHGPAQVATSAEVLRGPTYVHTCTHTCLHCITLRSGVLEARADPCMFTHTTYA